MSAPHTGTVLADRYELEDIVGKGGHGVVYRGRDRVAERGVAVKMLSDEFAQIPEYIARLVREHEALSALGGTSAVAVYDFCRGPNGAPCLVMELLDGTDFESTLSDLEERGERLPLPRIVTLLEPIVDTLERAHEGNILHRDLKPGNIFLLANDGGVRLFDFGLSRKMGSLRLTAAGTVMGSPSYIAPEVWKGESDELDPRVDVYSLGVILFRTLSGKLPFVGKNLRDSLAKATTAQRPSLHELRPELPQKIDRWVEKALAIDRDQRFPSVTALFMDLLRILELTPSLRSIRPVQESIANAWKAATSALRRFLPGGEEGEGERGARSRSGTGSPEEWQELRDDEIETESSRPRDSWLEVTDDELNRRSLYQSPSTLPDAPAPEPVPAPPTVEAAPPASEEKPREKNQKAAGGASKAKGKPRKRKKKSRRKRGHA